MRIFAKPREIRKAVHWLTACVVDTSCFLGDQMLHEEIQAQLRRLQVHPVNLDVMPDENGKVLVRGSLMAHWDVPQIVDRTWFLHILNELPDIAGPKATMDAFCAAHASSTSI